MSEISDAITNDAVAGISKVTVDGQTVEMMSVADRIEADKHASTATAKSKNHFGLFFRQLEPGGCG